MQFCLVSGLRLTPNREEHLPPCRSAVDHRTRWGSRCARCYVHVIVRIGYGDLRRKRHKVAH